MARKGGNPDIAKAGQKTQISKENQPTGEAKSNGWTKKSTLKEIMKLEVGGVVSEARRQEILTYLGLPADSEITIEQMLHMKQIMLSLKSNKAESTAAYRAVNDRAFGQPKQEIDVTSDGKPIKQNVIKLADGTDLPI